MPLMMPSPSILPVHLSKHDINTPENDNAISHGQSQAHVFKNGKIDETRWPHTVTIRIRRTIADKIKSQLPFRPFNAPISFASLRAQATNFRLGIDNRAF